MKYISMMVVACLLLSSTTNYAEDDIEKRKEQAKQYLQAFERISEKSQKVLISQIQESLGDKEAFDLISEFAVKDHIKLENQIALLKLLELIDEERALLLQKEVVVFYKNKVFEGTNWKPINDYLDAMESIGKAAGPAFWDIIKNHKFKQVQTKALKRVLTLNLPESRTEIINLLSNGITDPTSMFNALAKYPDEDGKAKEIFYKYLYQDNLLFKRLSMLSFATMEKESILQKINNYLSAEDRKSKEDILKSISTIQDEELIEKLSDFLNDKISETQEEARKVILDFLSPVDIEAIIKRKIIRDKKNESLKKPKFYVEEDEKEKTDDIKFSTLKLSEEQKAQLDLLVKANQDLIDKYKIKVSALLLEKMPKKPDANQLYNYHLILAETGTEDDVKYFEKQYNSAGEPEEKIKFIKIIGEIGKSYCFTTLLSLYEFLGEALDEQNLKIQIIIAMRTPTVDIKSDVEVMSKILALYTVIYEDYNENTFDRVNKLRKREMDLTLKAVTGEKHVADNIQAWQEWWKAEEAKRNEY